MLNKLLIKNYAIIDKVNMRPVKGLNIITGETGAGKSIIMGALGLALGNRTEGAILKTIKEKCIIEAVFKIKKENTEIFTYIQDNDLDIEDNTIIIRREISTIGKSRSFINDTPVMLSTLKKLAVLLVDQHQQFDHLLVGNKNFQQQVVDTLSNNNELLKKYQTIYNEWLALNKRLLNLQQQKTNFNKEYDFVQFQYNELDELQLENNELENLLKDLKVIESAGDIKNALAKINFTIYENDNAVINTLKQLHDELDYYQVNDELITLAKRLKSAEIELKDIAQEADNINNKLFFDEKKLFTINERISSGYKLLKKHGVQTTNELIEIKDHLQKKLQDVFSIDGEIKNVETKLKEVETECFIQAKVISKNRHVKSIHIEKQVNELLQKIGMPNAKIKIAIITLDNLTPYGLDTIGFLFDANKTGEYEPVEKVASGGELSRLMLCIKSLVARYITLPTLIFDEIDTGISGEAARQVGIIMKELAQHIQVISITHQPQIASMADEHYYVYKDDNGKTVNTNIRVLSKPERIQQIAEMLSGNNPSSTSLQTATEMLEKV